MVASQETPAARLFTEIVVCSIAYIAQAEGSIDRDGWEVSMGFLKGLPDQQIRADLSVDELIDESLLP